MSDYKIQKTMSDGFLAPSWWGPPFWFTLHTGSKHYPIKASPIVIERMKGFIKGMPYLLPCSSCQGHAIGFITQQEDQLDLICSGREQLFAFFVDFHNMINVRFNKPCYTIEEAKKLYF